jgi:hypothetical protein
MEGDEERYLRQHESAQIAVVLPQHGAKCTGDLRTSLYAKISQRSPKHRQIAFFELTLTLNVFSCPAAANGSNGLS